MTVAKHVFFLGLGGIGMSALARHLHSLGHVVGGYDLTPSPLLDRLKAEGIWVGHSDAPDDLPPWAQHKELTLVWTPAVPADFRLKRHFEFRGIQALKRAELLGAITRDRPTLAVAGTHGKTTTSSWLADMLMAHPEGCHAFLGGIDATTGTNLLTRPGAAWHIVEADEFDRSFHQLHPTHAAVTNLDPDHLDVYGTEEAFREAFHTFGSQVTQTLIVPHDLPWPSQKSLERFAVVDLGEDVPEGVDHLATLSPETREVAFELHRNDPEKTCSFKAAPALAGRHNTANALVAAALASHGHVGAYVLAQRVAHFGGVKRRMEVHLDTPEATYIDDYAHHPSELDALLSAVRSRWPDRHVTMVFQPHLYSRTRDFGAEFAQVLGQVDRLFLLPIYPAREAPIPGVDAQWLFDNISSPDKHLVASDSIFTSLKACPVDVLVTAGAGDIDRLVPKALQHMRDRRK
ncbi:MAG TPA: UDP-N-acetylmuramate--L-alanine ligase [Flavobacteriales bacterium]|nr:UDP-N-acetylmuramate--L-alanine ligase [Flavobacteriales bacterium]